MCKFRFIYFLSSTSSRCVVRLQFFLNPPHYWFYWSKIFSSFWDNMTHVALSHDTSQFFSFPLHPVFKSHFHRQAHFIHKSSPIVQDMYLTIFKNDNSESTCPDMQTRYDILYRKICWRNNEKKLTITMSVINTIVNVVLAAYVINIEDIICITLI